MGVLNPGFGQGCRITLGGARSMAGLRVHRCIGEQLSEADLLVECSALQLITSLSCFAISALINNQLRQTIFTAQREFFVVEVFNELIEELVVRYLNVR